MDDLVFAPRPGLLEGLERRFQHHCKLEFTAVMAAWFRFTPADEISESE